MAGAWDGLRKKLGLRTRYSPPRLAGEESARILKDALEEFYDRGESRFRRVFLAGKPLATEPHEQPWFERYAEAGLVRPKAAGVYLPCARVFPLNGAMIATDLHSHVGEDQVFSLMLEQVYIIDQMSVRPGDRALELCVGSGVNSLFLSDKAGSVTCVDVSPRAIEFARFNVAVNPGNVAVNLRQGSLFEPLDTDERFDLVLVNPPFEPVPPGASHMLHSYGGEDGLDVVREILAGARAHLAPGGRLEMFTWSPGDDESALVVDLLRESFPERRIEVHRVDSMPLEDRIRKFRSERGFAAWRDRLHAAGFSCIWGVFVRVEEDGPAETVVVEHPQRIQACVEVVREWS